jgi:hypothetical protein
LTLNHLSTHRVVEVCNLFECNSLLVKLLGIFSYLNDVFMDFKAHF